MQEIERNVEQAASGTNDVSSSFSQVTQVFDAAGEMSRQSDTLRGEVQKLLDTLRGA